MSLISQLLVLLIVTLALRPLLRRRRHRLPLPPGPKGLPIIGSLWDISQDQDLSWIRLWKWSRIYGDVFQFEVLGHRTVVLSSQEAITTLLEKRSWNYSDRPDMPMFLELSGAEWSFVAFRHSDWWRLHRRTFHQRFQPRVMQEYYDIQRVATNTLIERLNASPDDFIEHINKFSSSMVLKIIYGYTLKEKDDPYYRLVYDAMEGILTGSNHGTFWVDYLPILKYVPSWLPGAGYKKKAQGWNKSILKLKEEPWSWVRRAVEEGTAEPSFCTQSAERLSITPGDNSVMENVVKNCATMSFVAGTDTSASALASFILAMVLNPELQVRAQKEIDGVVGSGRLPDFEDRDNLPFVNALLAETLRWGTVTPLAIAHRATDDDVYEGHFIPAGTTVIANSWAVLHDEKLYGRNPLDFDPYRFMNNDGKAPPSPELFAFGFGRRICPGRYFAINTIYLAISRLLASFTIARAIDDEGNEIIPDPGFTDGLATRGPSNAGLSREILTQKHKNRHEWVWGTGFAF
ncbi:hypothetical protein AAF712_005119 [Marasmius tenuissimus]|uniref:Cytochrome P450 n=1 Tax=Marasmius tenuissimus TaxID=585030 RepID=A0ABR3A1X3_9AGAR